ncbi:hypothetical protein FB451DRAFT_1176081 [Mycena latifolia]|nr:hypothetical protein FB451DRAFT_1176081 [Mycena latifolia]
MTTSESKVVLVMLATGKQGTGLVRGMISLPLRVCIDTHVRPQPSQKSTATRSREVLCPSLSSRKRAPPLAPRVASSFISIQPSTHLALADKRPERAEGRTGPACTRLCFTVPTGDSPNFQTIYCVYRLHQAHPPFSCHSYSDTCQLQVSRTAPRPSLQTLYMKSKFEKELNRYKEGWIVKRQLGCAEALPVCPKPDAKGPHLLGISSTTKITEHKKNLGTPNPPPPSNPSHEVDTRHLGPPAFLGFHRSTGVFGVGMPRPRWELFQGSLHEGSSHMITAPRVSRRIARRVTDGDRRDGGIQAGRPVVTVLECCSEGEVDEGGQGYLPQMRRDRAARE